MRLHPWRTRRYTKYGLWTRQRKMICQRKTRRNAPYEWLELSQDLTFPLSPPESQTSHTVLFSFLVKTLVVPLLSLFVGILFCKAKGPASWHWSRVQWLGFGALTSVVKPNSPVGNINSASNHCRPRPPEIRVQTGCVSLGDSDGWFLNLILCILNFICLCIVEKLSILNINNELSAE